MTNAKKEFLSAIAETMATVLWAKFTTETKSLVSLAPEESSSSEDWEYFLNALDYEYDSGFNGEYTEGFIYLSDNSWFEREEYKGCSRWVLRVPPKF